MLARLAGFVTALPIAALAAVALAADATGPIGRVTVVAPPAKASAATVDTAEAAPPAAAAPALALPAPSPPADPAECRMGCAQAYYFCRAGEQTGDCGSAWSQCVATCNSPNLDPGVSTAP
jgi:pyruvate/2-oxoglutarate dehydrogenase complex dihydrolipoamide acyltransferase (E2) component